MYTILHTQLTIILSAMRHIRDCFNAKYNQICSQARRLEEFSTTIKRYLPESFHPHCRVISFQNGCLVIGTIDAAWASQLRYVLPELRDQLRVQEKWYQLISVKIMINLEIPIVSPSGCQQKPERNSPWQKILQSLYSSK